MTTKNNSRLKIIAEIASNWNGNEKLGKKIIKRCLAAGANYVKFQMWKATDLYKKSHPNWNEIKKSELKPIVARNFKKYSDDLGIDCIWSVFYPEAVDILEELDVSLYKVASRTSALMDFNSLDTMLRIARTKKPVIISMGLGGNKNKINQIFKHNKKHFLYCISKYPTKINELNFTTMLKYDGFSDHTEGSLAPLIYTLKSKNLHKLKFLEKHVCVEESVGPDRAFSMQLTDFEKMISDIRTIESIRM